MTTRLSADNVVKVRVRSVSGVRRAISATLTGAMTSLSVAGDDTIERPVGRATMRDVAALAGVSLKTVSRVVNREPGVAAATAERVERAAARLAFRPNLAASSLRRADGRTSMLGLLLEDVANPFSAALHRGVEETARARGVAVIAASLDEDPSRERALVRALVAHRVDGLVLAPTAGQQGYLSAELRAGLSIAFVDREPVGIEADVVLADNRAGARDGVAHLIAQGHRRIGFLGGNSLLSTARDRHDAYADALADAGITLDRSLVVRDVLSVEEADGAAERMLARRDPPTAIFAAQNLIAMGTVTALRRLGHSREIALVGFDDFPMAGILDPGVTVVAQDPVRMGGAAADLAFARIDDPERPVERIVVPTSLVTRGSGEIPPTR